LDLPGLTVADPQLAKDSFGILRPKDGSPLIDAASAKYDLGLPDMDGEDRAHPFDIGADERLGAPERGPIDKCAAGPQTYRVDNCSMETSTKKPKPPVSLARAQ